MYLEHFRMNDYPFSLTPNTDFYCDLPAYQGALNVLLVSLNCGEGFIKIVGEVGTGKTLLCRKLLANLPKEFVSAYIPSPDVTPEGIRRALAQELGIQKVEELDSQQLLDAIFKVLLELHSNNKKVVLIIDEAQALSHEALEALRLLTNLETEKTKLLQVVLFGQPELDEMLADQSMRQVKQRISFSYDLPALKQNDLIAYMQHRVSVAGFTYGSLFSNGACKLVHKFSKGTPRLVNIICHKALMLAYGRGRLRVNSRLIRIAASETEGVTNRSRKWLVFSSAVIALIAVVIFELNK